ncbi:MAG: HD domain-containing protein [Rhodothalassiaceae bacterium]
MVESFLVNRQGIWGKWSERDGESHHLIHHCADVAAVFLALV